MNRLAMNLDNVGGSEQNRSVANVQSDDLWPSRMHAATHIVQEKTHACGVLKRHNFWVHVSLGSAETLVRRGGIINHHSIAYSLSNISAKNYRNRLMWVESIQCVTSVSFFWETVYKYAHQIDANDSYLFNKNINQSIKQLMSFNLLTCIAYYFYKRCL